MHTVLLFVWLLLWVSPASAYVRNLVNGPDGRVWRAERNANNTISLYRNDSLSGVPQPGGTTLSLPAMTRLNNTLYLVVRGTEGANRIYCRRLNLSSLAWIDPNWIYINGATLDAPALSSDGSRVYAAVRGTNNLLYYRDITSCGTEPWVLAVPSPSMLPGTAPQMVADPPGSVANPRRIYFQDANQQIRVFTIGSSGTSVVRAFGSDMELRGAQFRLFNPSDQNTGTSYGWGTSGGTEDHHKVLYFGDAASPAVGSGACSSGVTALTNMRRGVPGSTLCYAAETAGQPINTGQTQVNFVFSPFPNSDRQYSWRSCMVGTFFSTDTAAPNCDFGVPLSFFISMSATTQIRLRAFVFINTASHDTTSPNNLSTVGLSFMLKPSLIGTTETVEMVMLPYFNNISSAACSQSLRLDIAPRPVFFFTPGCAVSGAPLVSSGQGAFYNLDLRPYILNKIANRWRDDEGNTAPGIVTTNPAHWFISWGLSTQVRRVDLDRIEATVGDVGLEVRA